MPYESLFHRNGGNNAEGKIDTVTLGGMDFARIEHEYFGETNTVFMGRNDNVPAGQ